MVKPSQFGSAQSCLVCSLPDVRSGRGRERCPSPDVVRQFFGQHDDRRQVVGNRRFCRFVDIDMQKRARVLLVAATSAALIACRSPGSVGTEPSTSRPTATAPASSLATAPFGGAKVQPDSIKAGSPFTVTPAAEIQPICPHMAEIYTRTEPLRFVGALGSDGSWQPASPSVPVTYPPRQMPRSQEAASFRWPTDVPPGDYVVCIEAIAPQQGARDKAGCGPVAVENQ